MKKNFKHILAAAVLFIVPLVSGAQALKGSYFLDNSMNRHEMNPAFAPRADYFQMLGIGNLGLGLGTNLGIPTFFYPGDNELLPFLNQKVSVEDFDKALPAHPHFDVDLNTTLFGFGFYTKNLSYWTFDLDVRTMIDADIPRDLFMFMKRGTGAAAQSFNIGNVNMYATAALQASLGYSRNIIKGLRAGVKARFIAPVAYAALNLENVRLDTAPDKWTLVTEGYAHAAMSGLDLSIPQGETMPSMEFDLQRMLANKVMAGWGVSFDLGVEYTLELGTIFDGLSVSAAVTDLGVINYRQDAVSSFKSAGEVTWDGFQDVSLDNMEFEESLNQLITEAKENLINLSEMETESGFKRSTMPRFYVGAEMPFLRRKMSVGLLYSARKSHSYSRQELTVSYNLNPCKWFALGVNYSFLNTARTMGALLEFTPKWGPAFYLGCDYIPASFAKAPIMGDGAIIPLAFRLNMNFGIALHLGSKHLKKNKEVKSTEN